MESKILLNKNTGVFSTNVESSLNVDLSTKNRLLSGENTLKEFSLYNQYNKERDNCDKFRLLLAINPICSNILYNAKTEIVINEGSPNMTVICDCSGGSQYKENQYSGSGENIKITHIGVAPSATSSISLISYMDAIRNTEYSHPQLGNFSYQCGYNIFNNHMLRSDGYVHINGSISEKDNTIGTDKEELKWYNTLHDYARDSLGNIIEQEVSPYRNITGNTQMHVYTMDNIISLKNAFRERLEERDGWWGFINPSYTNIPNRLDLEKSEILTNTLIASKKPCDFIDLYPDRSLYSFIPKFNKYRNRIEKNWDYCITYPYAKDYNKVREVCGASNFSMKVEFSLKYNSSGNEILECSSYFKHNLAPNSQIRLYYYIEGNDNLQTFGRTVRVETVGDANGQNKDRIFSIKYDDVLSIYEELNNTNKNTFFFKRLSGNVECEYYFRKFKKLRNLDGSELRSDINKIAFSKNIYGDDTAQIIFTDDVDVSGLLDNNGRPVSEVYLTIIKRNAGHDLWYQEENINNYSDLDDNYWMPDLAKSASTIEFSHCFGKVTSGLDFSGMKNEPFNYNIHRMHNLEMEDSAITQWFREYDKLDFDFNESGDCVYCKMKNADGTFPANENWKDSNPETICDKKEISASTLSDRFRTFVMWGDAVFDKPLTLEDDITINENEFYGDVVEYDIVNCRETIVSNVYHRVNTAQRETFDRCFRDILEDKIVSDDYDIYVQSVGQRAEALNQSGFTIKTYYLNNGLQAGLEYSSGLTSVYDEVEGRKGLIYGNIMPEGNYYNPHTRIKLKNESDIISESPAKIINYANVNAVLSGNIFTFVYPTDYGFYKGDVVGLYDKTSNILYWCNVLNVDKHHHKISIQINDDLIYLKYRSIENMCANEAHFIGNTRIYEIYWSPNSMPSYAKLSRANKNFVWRTLTPPSELPTTNELYDMTFSNGRFYVEKNINFFLRRQDPFGKYGLSAGQFIKIEKNISNPMDDFIIEGSKQADFSGVIYSINNFENCY